MRYLKLFMIIAGLSCCYVSQAQGWSYDEVNAKSYALYQQGSWKELLVYGRQAVAGGQDFSLLRQRMGYAAFQLGNYSETIKQYMVVLKNDSYNSTAHYYIWLSRKYLNQPELAMMEVPFLANEVTTTEKLKPSAFAKAGVELSFKQTDVVVRKNPVYARGEAGYHLGWKFHISQSFATYQQHISEPLLTGVNNAQDIRINQSEFYNRFLINLGHNWQAKLAYHYVNTPFNNLTYQNHLALAGICYHGNYVDVQADAVIGRVTDSAYTQLNFQLGYYPLGNLNLYGFSTLELQPGVSKSANFRQVLGVKLMKNFWVEGNMTLGRFVKLTENDALYLYNAVDPDKFKGGITGYFSAGRNCVVQLGYTYEQKELFLRPNTFNQYSITGGFSWKF